MTCAANGICSAISRRQGIKTIMIGSVRLAEDTLNSPFGTQLNCNVKHRSKLNKLLTKKRIIQLNKGSQHEHWATPLFFQSPSVGDDHEGNPAHVTPTLAVQPMQTTMVPTNPQIATKSIPQSGGRVGFRKKTAPAKVGARSHKHRANDTANCRTNSWLMLGNFMQQFRGRIQDQIPFINLDALHPKP